ncbi:MAG: hypothetical protein V3571_08215 [Pseudodesulfovibrio sp.]
MIDAAGTTDETRRRLRRLPADREIGLRTDKRDLSPTIVRTDVDRYEIRQDGFELHIPLTDEAGLKRRLRTLLKTNPHAATESAFVTRLRKAIPPSLAAQP